MEYKDLTDEQRAKVDACKTPEELLALAAEEGMELSDEQLEKVSGGWGDSDPTCPSCGSSNLSWDSMLGVHICNNCGYEFG